MDDLPYKAPDCLRRDSLSPVRFPDPVADLGFTAAERQADCADEMAVMFYRVRQCVHFAGFRVWLLSFVLP